MQRRAHAAAMLAATVLVFLSASSLAAQSCTAGPPTQLGTVSSLGACDSGSLPRTTCNRLLVSCDGLPPLEVLVRVTEPDPGLPLRGTVVLGTGGGGTGFYSENQGGAELFHRLAQLGFRLVERSWASPGWFGNAFSVKKQSCRYATLLTWIRLNVHTTGVFCATGNSGGSGELGYALTTWNRGAILDVAVPTGGPPMSRLDFLCGADSQWLAQCPGVVPPGVSECAQVACTVPPTNAVCTACSTTAGAAELLLDSILHPAAVLSFPTTRVHLIWGAMDCTSAMPAGQLFYAAVTSEKVREFAPGTPHWVAGTAAGRDAIVRALLGGASCRPGPGTLDARQYPSVGGTLDLDVHGPAQGLFAVGLALSTQILEVTPFGWVFVGEPFALIGLGALDGMGRGSVPFAVPANPGLAGLPVFDQAIAGACLTNLTRVVLLP